MNNKIDLKNKLKVVQNKLEKLMDPTKSWNGHENEMIQLQNEISILQSMIKEIKN